MIQMTVREYLHFLWWIAWLNIGGGALIWLWNAVQIEFFLGRSEIMEAMLWQSTGVDLMGFGIIVLVIALAVSALVTALAASAVVTSPRNSADHR